MSVKPNSKRLLQTEGKWHLPFPTGKFPVIGYHDIMTGNSKDDGVYVRLLYPAADQSVKMTETHHHWPNWYPHPLYKEGVEHIVSPRFRPFVRVCQYFQGDVHIPILPNVKPSTQYPFPVILFSHGMTGNLTTYSNLCNKFASHGFIVGVIEHRDQSAYATLIPSGASEGEKLERLPYRRMSSFGESHFEGRQAQIQVRIKEVQAVLELIGKLNSGHSLENVLQQADAQEQELDYALLRGVFDMEKVVIAGHSYGGATALFALKEEPNRLKMGLCLDAWMFTLRDFEVDTVKQPILFINMENFQSEESLLKMDEFLQFDDEDGKRLGQRRVLTIKGSQHSDLSDFPLFLMSFPSWITSVVNWILPIMSKSNPFSLQEATAFLCVEFIHKHLTENDGDGLSRENFPEEIDIEERPLPK